MPKMLKFAIFSLMLTAAFAHNDRTDWKTDGNALLDSLLEDPGEELTARQNAAITNLDVSSFDRALASKKTGKGCGDMLVSTASTDAKHGFPEDMLPGPAGCAEAALQRRGTEKKRSRADFGAELKKAIALFKNELKDAVELYGKKDPKLAELVKAKINQAVALSKRLKAHAKILGLTKAGAMDNADKDFTKDALDLGSMFSRCAKEGLCDKKAFTDKIDQFAKVDEEVAALMPDK